MTRVATLVDTSVLFALADADSEQHARVSSAIVESREALVVPITVLPELDYLVATRLGARIQHRVLQAFLADEFQVENLARTDLRRSLELMNEYADHAIGLVDASIVAVAERLRITRILTLDRRHFQSIRPRHCSAFEIIP
jgi:predicted nucleic acid-binding protein